jgi:3'-phosphoadenosine 5'-phosphosulfate sulfotransferase (PAPS reductase)/FAD synthetase
MDDPLRPGLDTPTDIDLIARLTMSEREERVKFLIAQADEIVQMALDEHGTRHTLAGTCVLFSGGNDSTVLAHLMRKHSTHAVHCNTTIGIEETRQFVRDVCAGWGLPLIEETAPVSYRELVLEQGFPGPGHHYKVVAPSV